jgi:hypothetical protein
MTGARSIPRRFTTKRQRNAEYRRKFTFVMARNKYLSGRTLFQLFI